MFKINEPQWVHLAPDYVLRLKLYITLPFPVACNRLER